MIDLSRNQIQALRSVDAEAFRSRLKHQLLDDFAAAPHNHPEKDIVFHSDRAWDEANTQGIMREADCIRFCYLYVALALEDTESPDQKWVEAVFQSNHPVSEKLRLCESVLAEGAA